MLLCTRLQDVVAMLRLRPFTTSPPCRMVTGGAKRQDVCIGFGDGRFSSTSPGSVPSPVRALRHAFGAHAFLVETPEFRTSKTCSKCRGTVQNARLPVRTWHGPPTRAEFQRFGVLCWQKRLPVHGVQVGLALFCCRLAPDHIAGSWAQCFPAELKGHHEHVHPCLAARLIAC